MGNIIFWIWNAYENENENKIYLYYRDHSQNITAVWRLSFFRRRNLGVPLLRIGRISVPPSKDWQNLSTPTSIFQKPSIFIIWPYLRYSIFFFW